MVPVNNDITIKVKYFAEPIVIGADEDYTVHGTILVARGDFSYFTPILDLNIPLYRLVSYAVEAAFLSLYDSTGEINA